MTTADLGRAAATLAAAPSDLDTWLRLAGLLASAGRKDEAETVFAALGKAACVGGQVALAVACARWLGLRGAVAGDALVEEIIARHAAGSSHIDPSARPNPPILDGENAPEEIAPESMDEAVAVALRAIAQAASAAVVRAPASYPPTPLVSSLPPDDVRVLIDAMSLTPLERGAVVIEIGQPATHLYWIARGAVTVTRDGYLLGELQSGAFFGEIALIGGGNRTADVTCSMDTWLLSIPARDVEVMAAKHARLAKALARYARARLLANVLRTSELFARLSEEDKGDLLGRFETVMVPPGDRVICRGGENDHLWIVVTGQCEVRSDELVLATLGPGDGVGEISLLAKKPATADVIALKPTAFLRLARAEFEQVAVRYPQLLAEVYRLLVAREHALQSLVHDASDLVV